MGCGMGPHQLAARPPAKGVSIALAFFYGAMTKKGCALMVSKNTALLNFARYPFASSVCNPASTTKYRSRLDSVSRCA
jgi:hypothetical protein